MLVTLCVLVRLPELLDAPVTRESMALNEIRWPWYCANCKLQQQFNFNAARVLYVASHECGLVGIEAGMN
jgi:hypothetical protein